MFKKDPLKVRIGLLEEALIRENQPDRIAAIEAELYKLYDLRAKKTGSGLQVTGDGLIKAGVVIGLAAIGYAAERKAIILPKWSSPRGV